MDEYTMTGSTPCIIANRISYAFDFRGRSMVIDTACSSSLVAIHQACRSLQSGESTLALAGAVNLMITQVASVGFSQLHALSPDGRSKAFDASANGYARGEGAGVVVLKRLSDAVAANDHIYAVIRGGAVNQDGRTNGLTAPNRWSQEAVLRQASTPMLFGLSPADVQYVEPHGTGTLLGDPIEAAALGSVIGQGRPADRPCLIGSVKTNIGHLESAAGVASVIKTALALQERTIPASLHFQTPNPHIPFERLHLRVQNERGDWPASDGPARAGVSAFGFGGTNAHLVLEEAPPRQATAIETSKPEDSQLLILSARSDAALRTLARSFRDFVIDEDDGRQATLADICQHAATKRTHHRHRLSIVARSREQLAADLDAFARHEPQPSTSYGRRLPAGAPKVGFMLPEFAADSLHGLFAARPDLRSELELFAGGETEGLTVESRNFRFQYALAQLWRSWGVEPVCLTGHSSADLMAGCLSENISLQEALAHLQSEDSAEPTGSAEIASDELDQLQQQGIRLLVVLGAAAATETNAHDPAILRLLPSLREGETTEPLLASLGVLYTQGVDLDWTRFYGARVGRHVALPTYPFQLERYWWRNLAAPVAKNSTPVTSESVTATPAVGIHPMLGKRLDSVVPVFETQLDMQRLTFLADHRVREMIVLPGSALVELALAAAGELFGAEPMELENVRFEQMLILTADQVRTIQVSLSEKSEGTSAFRIHARSRDTADQPGSWVLHASGNIVRSATSAAPHSDADVPQALRRRLEHEQLPSQLYSQLAQGGLNYGETFRAIERLWSGTRESLGQVALPRELRETNDAWQLHPVTLDACLQVIAAALPAEMIAAREGGLLVPVGIGRIRRHRAMPPRVWSHCTVRTAAQAGHGRSALGATGRRACSTKMGNWSPRFEIFVSPAFQQAQAPSQESRRSRLRLLPVALAASDGVRKVVPAITSGELLPTLKVLLSLSGEARRSLLEGYLRRRVAETLEIAESQLDVNEPLLNIGIDSLMVFKLGAELDAELGLDIRLEDLMDGPSVSEFTDRLLEHLENG